MSGNEETMAIATPIGNADNKVKDAYLTYLGKYIRDIMKNGNESGKIRSNIDKIADTVVMIDLAHARINSHEFIDIDIDKLVETVKLTKYFDGFGENHFMLFDYGLVCAILQLLELLISVEPDSPYCDRYRASIDEFKKFAYRIKTKK